MTKPKTHIVAHTDGACRGNPGPGGWGVVLSITTPSGKTTTRELKGGERATTNNRMELWAAITALESRKTKTRFTIYGDSKYVIDGMNNWIEGWQRMHWRKTSGKSLKNVDLWQRLAAAAVRHSVTWHWIKGHSGDEANERADALAGEGLEEALAPGRG